MKNILLCNNSMGIGGVETVILNQITAFTKKGYNVYVLAGKGVYSDRIEELGGHFIECDFPEENEINSDRINKIVRIIKENNITEIHIHKYQCIPSLMIAICKTGIPYFAYEHGFKDTKKYYTWNYPIYKFFFPIYFKNAYKIIAITPKVAEITQKEYNLKKEKYIIIHNGIDFDTYKNTTPNYNDSVNKIYIISRIDEEKLPPIYYGIELFENYLKINQEAKLYIIGDGNAKEKIIKYLNDANLKVSGKDKEAKVILLGAQSDVIKYLKDADILLGIGRCALEAIAMEVPVIITGYDGVKGLLTKDKMKIAMEENFSGINMNTISEKECINDILFLKENKKQIVEEIYKIAKENLDCKKNYISIPDNTKFELDWFQIFDLLKKGVDYIEKQSDDIKEKYDYIQKIKEENKQLEEMLEDKRKLTNELQERNSALQKELNEVYNSKRWKYTEKMSKFFHKK